MFAVIHLPTAECFYRRVEDFEVGSVWFCENEINQSDTSIDIHDYSNNLDKICPDWINNKEKLFNDIKDEFYSFYASATGCVKSFELEIIEIPDV